MIKKFLSILMIMFVILVSVTNVHAADGLFHTGMYEDIYKLSEQSDIDLPFLNMFMNAATYDKDVNHSGISFGSTTIDVNEKLEGMHAIISSDMVTIKGEVENAFIYANNVVIEGKIASDSIIIAPTVHIKPNAVIGKDIIIMANNLTIEGTVNGNVIATVTEKATVSGKINNDFRIVATDLIFENEQISGDVYVETAKDMTTLKEKYPNAVVKNVVLEAEQQIDWMSVISNGIVTVIVYTLVAWLLTRKENNIVEKACAKFKANTTYGLIIAIIVTMFILAAPIFLILLGAIRLGFVAWPIFIAHISLLLFVGTTAMLISGAALYNTIKNKVGKFKIPAIALIYIVLYVLKQITVISAYVNIAMFLIALALVVTMITRKLPKAEPTAKKS